MGFPAFLLDSRGDVALYWFLLCTVDANPRPAGTKMMVAEQDYFTSERETVFPAFTLNFDSVRSILTMERIPKKGTTVVCIIALTVLFGVLALLMLQSRTLSEHLSQHYNTSPAVLLSADSLPFALCSENPNHRNTHLTSGCIVLPLRSAASFRPLRFSGRQTVHLYFLYGKLRPHLFLCHLRN